MVTYKTIEGYDGYRFGDDGSAWSCWRNNGKMSDDWHQLKGTPSTHYGHTIIEVLRDGRRVKRPLHRLILEAFVGPCPSGMEACHGPGGKFDNRPCNLRWDTHEANIRDKAAHGTQAYGEQSSAAKITEVQAATVIALSQATKDQKWIAQITGVGHGSVHQIAKGKQWKHLHKNGRWRQVLEEAATLDSVATAAPV